MRGLFALGLVCAAAASGCGDEAAGAVASGQPTGSTGSGGASSGSGGAGASGGAAAGGSGQGGSGGSGGGGPIGSQSAYYWGDFDADGDFRVGYADYPAGNVAVLSPAGLNGGFVHRVAVSADGGRIAIAGSDTMGTPALLQVYDALGAGAPVVLADAASFDNEYAFFDEVAFSPDGQRVAFNADLELAGSRSLYVVAAGGTGGPERLSPAPSSSGLNVETLRWFDDTRIVYLGDPVDDQVHGLWIVDAASPNPVPLALVPESQLSATQNVAVSNVEVDAQGRIYFRSDHQTDGVFRIHRVDPDAQNLEHVAATALSNGSGEASVGGFSMSPSGGALAFFSDAPVAGLAQLQVLDVASDAVATVSALQSAPIGAYSGDKLDRPSWSLDEARLAVIADWLVDDEFEVFLVPASGNPGGVRVLGPSQSGQGMDATQAELSSDGSRLFVRGDLQQNNLTELYSTADLTSSGQSPASTVIEAVPDSGSAVAGFTRTP